MEKLIKFIEENNLKYDKSEKWGSVNIYGCHVNSMQMTQLFKICIDERLSLDFNRDSLIFQQF